MILALVLAAAPLADRDWQYITRDRAQSEWYYDPATLKDDGRGWRRAWIFIDHRNDRTERARRSLGLVSIQCADERAHWAQFTKFSPGGEPLPEQTSSETFYIIPGTVMETIKHRLCPAS